MQHASLPDSSSAVAIAMPGDIAEIVKPTKPRSTTWTGSIRVDRASFAVAVAAVMRTVDKCKTIPILANLKLAVADGVLIVTGTDLDREFSAPCLMVGGETEFATTLPGHKLSDLLKKAKASDAVAIDVTRTTTWRDRRGNDPGDEPFIAEYEEIVKLALGGLNVRMEGLAPADFPVMSKCEASHTFTLATADLLRVFGKTVMAVSTEETRYYLNGVYLHSMPEPNGVKRHNGSLGTLRGVATDGHRMAVCDVAAPAGVADMPGVIVPLSTVNDMLRFAKAKCAPESIAVRLSSAKVEFTIGTITVLSKLIDGTYPDYQRVIPSGNDKRLALDCAELADGIKQVCVMSSERGKSVKLSLGRDELRLSTVDPDGGSASMTVPADYSADPLDIGFNSGYCLDILGMIDSERVEFMLANPGSPTIIRGAGDADKGVSYVIMPMRV